MRRLLRRHPPPPETPPPERLLDALSVAVVVCDERLTLMRLNAAAEAMFGVGRNLATGMSLAEALPVFAPHVARLAQALAEGTGFIEREFSLHEYPEAGSRPAPPPDAPTHVDWTVTPLAEGRVRTLLLECAGLDPRRVSRDEHMLFSQQASRDLVRNLAHEIKNPLGGIRGAAQLLEREFPDSEHREFTRVIIREADRLQALVNRLLGPDRAPRKQEINIHEVLEDVRRLLEAEAARSGRVSIVRDYDPSLPDLTADRDQLVQALLNIGGNALQALSATGRAGQIVLRTRARRRVTVAGRTHRMALAVEIEDNGPGVPPLLQDKIFFPMVTGRAGGTGLGLPIAQVIAQGHGGTIEHRSRAGCTVFSLILPYEGPFPDVHAQ